MKTQVELELEAYSFGKDRMRKSLDRNEEKGGAYNNPYAQAIYRRFVLPLSAAVRADLDTPRIGRAQAHVPLLRDMDSEAVAFVAVRAVLGKLMSDHSDTADRSGRPVLDAAGRAVYHEHLLTEFADASPTLFYHLLHDLDRRLSANEAHRMTVLKMQGRKNGVEFTEWSQAQVVQVGSYLVDQLALLGMVNVEMQRTVKLVGGRKMSSMQTSVSLTEDVRALITQISDFIVETTPYFEPCVEPPRDWVAIDDGGFHTPEMRRLSPWMVQAFPGARDEYRASDLSNEMAAVNALQRVKWRVNSRLLDAVSRISEHYDMDEIIAQAESPRPPRPIWLDRNMTKEQMTDAQQKEFRMWKREVAEWHTSERVRGTKSNRFYNAMRVARKFKDYPELFFVYFVDFRGRKYVKTTGISPQGSDLQKALLEFAEGKPLLTKEAQDWFCIAGANRYGYDKASLPDRVKWVHEHEDMILAFAADPVDNAGWQEADKPLQFLAWCMEYEQWQVFGDAFRSHLAVGMDGSCNGLQNFSAMLRDEQGGRATNLIPAELPNDIYQMVADRLTAILKAEEEDEEGYRTLWLEHGLTRTLVKRPVMTLPYGSRQSSWREFIVDDYLKQGYWPELDPALYDRLAGFLSRRLQGAISDVVVKAREAMDWLQRGSTAILNSGYDRIRWITPSGFPVTQVYWEQLEHRINTKLCGNAKLRIRKDDDDPKKSRHRNGIAPNFVHSLDASHLTLVVNAAKAEGVDSLAMIHDDYGTHAADAGKLYRIIREQFVAMYQKHDVLAEFHAAYPMLPEPPSMGTLDLSQVLDSPYFFS